jgi:hypothetical protein
MLQELSGQRLVFLRVPEQARQVRYQFMVQLFQSHLI